MKRKIIFLLALFVLHTAQAQVGAYKSSGYGTIKKTKPAYEWENFILFNYSYGINDLNLKRSSHAFGLTYGRVKSFGWYVNASIGLGMHYKYSYEADGRDGFISNPYGTPFYTGKHSDNLLSATFGGVVRLVVPLYIYAGAGYGYHTITAELEGGEWALLEVFAGKGHRANFDVGLQGNIKGFTIAAGYMILTDFTSFHTHEIKIGSGYTFKDIKK